MSFGTSSWFLEEVPGLAKARLPSLLGFFQLWLRAGFQLDVGKVQRVAGAGSRGG